MNLNENEYKEHSTEFKEVIKLYKFEKVGQQVDMQSKNSFTQKVPSESMSGIYQKA